MLDGRDWDAREHEQIAQRQRAFQTGVFLCMMLLMMDVRDPRAVQEEALRRARAEAEEAALRRQAAPTWLDNEIVGEGSTQNVTGLYRGGWVYNTHNSSTGPGGHEGRAALQMDMFRVASIEKVSVVRAMVQLAAPPGAGRSGDVLASAFGVYSTVQGAWRCWGTSASPLTMAWTSENGPTRRLTMMKRRRTGPS